MEDLNGHVFSKGEEGESGAAMKNEISLNEESHDSKNKLSIGAGTQDKSDKVFFKRFFSFIKASQRTKISLNFNNC